MRVAHHRLLRARLPLARAAVVALALTVANAQDDAGGLIYLTYDNDFIVGSDDGYSGGIHLGYVSRAADSYADTAVPEAVGHALDRLPLLNRPGRQRFVAYTLAQVTYTPEDTAREDLVEDDLPYSGLLLFSATAAAQDADHLDALTLTSGVIGPASLAEEVQRELHRASGSNQPRGWDNQLGNEPLLNAQYDHRWRIWDFASSQRTNGDAIISGSAAAGNWRTMADVGIGLRWGLNVPKDYFVPPPFFGQESVGALSLTKDRARVAYVALGVDAALVGNLIQYDGNTFRDSHRVDHDPWIGRAYAGLHARIGRAIMVVSFVQATVPWDRPDGARWERWGRATLGWNL